MVLAEIENKKRMKKLLNCLIKENTHFERKDKSKGKIKFRNYLFQLLQYGYGFAIIQMSFC